MASKWDRAARNEYSRQWAARNKDKRRETARRWRAKHGERHDAARRKYRAENSAKIRAAKEKWAKENPDRVAATNALARLRRERKQLNAMLQRHYDFTLDEFLALKAAQGNRCAICGATHGNSKGHRLYVDHDHATGIVRGLLCNRCNSAIGYFNEDTRRIRRAATYLEGWTRVQCRDAVGVQPVLGIVSEAPRQAESYSGLSEGEAACNGGADIGGRREIQDVEAVLR